MKSFPFILAVVAILHSETVSQAIFAVDYSIQLLEAPAGSIDSLAFALNNQGQVVGDSRLLRTSNVADSRPLIWAPTGQSTLLWQGQMAECVFDPIEMEFVCSPAVFPGGTALDINSHGQIVGRAATTDVGGVILPGPGIRPGSAFIWDSTLGRRFLGTLGGSSSEATGINDRGTVVGSAANSDQDSRAFVWSESEGMRDLGTLGGLDSFGNGVNNFGQVVGSSSRVDGFEHAFLFDEVNGMIDLMPGANFSSRAFAINDLGQVVGEFYANGRSAFIWDSQTGLHVLDSPQLRFASAHAINNLGQIVGEGDPSGTSRQPVLWDTTGLQPLQSLIPKNSGWELEYAADINDLGQIAGYGFYNGELRAFLMTPVPEPTSLALAAMGCLSALIAIAMKRFRAP